MSCPWHSPTGARCCSCRPRRLRRRRCCARRPDRPRRHRTIRIWEWSRRGAGSARTRRAAPRARQSRGRPAAGRAGSPPCRMDRPSQRCPAFPPAHPAQGSAQTPSPPRPAPEWREVRHCPSPALAWPDRSARDPARCPAARAGFHQNAGSGPSRGRHRPASDPAAGSRRPGHSGPAVPRPAFWPRPVRPGPGCGARPR